MINVHFSYQFILLEHLQLSFFPTRAGRLKIFTGIFAFEISSPYNPPLAANTGITHSIRENEKQTKDFWSRWLDFCEDQVLSAVAS